MSANFESGIFVNTPAWHKQGVVLKDVPDVDTAFRTAAMDWPVVKRAIYTHVDGQMVVEPRHCALIRRKDDKENVLGIAGAKYEILQNSEAMEWARPLVESGRWSIETAGVLCEGRKCWLLLKQGERQVVPGDVLKQYLLFHWGHDGFSPAVFQPTTIRVVCDNTLQESLGKGGLVKIVHSTRMSDKLAFVRKLFIESEDAFETQMKTFRMLLDKTFTDAMVEELIDKVYGPKTDSKAGLTIAKRRTDFLKGFVLEGGASGILKLGLENTGYGVFNALSEANEHFLFKGDPAKRMFNGGLMAVNNTVLEAVLAA